MFPAHPMLWAAFAGTVVLLLVVDVAIFGRRREPLSMRAAAAWTVAVALLAVAFAAAIWWRAGHTAATQFATGYVVELSLSVDNLLVFLLIFDYFGVTPALRHTALSWGIVGAIVMRAAVIAGGIVLIHQLVWILYALGALLIFTGVRMFAGTGEPEIDPSRNPMLRVARRVLPVSRDWHDAAFVVRERGRLIATPLLLVVIAIEWTDLVFAADSIPAIFAITRDPFLVYTSNVFAVFGLRALFFLLAGVLERFNRLRQGVAVVLVLVGLKMLLEHWITVPPVTMLVAIVVILGGSLLLSRARERAASTAQ
jgi:tellurite resistance protein TerC